MTETVSFKLDRTVLVKIDGLAANRSDFIREAVEEKLQRARRKKGQSVWDALERTAGLDITIPRAAGKVKRVDL
jgi:Arc/MetJ-type ribon-helix-helix transcriptional regulator